MFNLVNFGTGTVTYSTLPPVSLRAIYGGSQFSVTDANTVLGNSVGELIRFQRNTDHVGILIRNSVVGGNSNPMLLSEAIAGNSQNWSVRVTGDANHRLLTRANGTFEWGDGTNVRDTLLSRTAAGTLTLTFAGAATTSILDIPGSLQLGKTTVDLGGGAGVLGMANAVTAPAKPPCQPPSRLPASPKSKTTLIFRPSHK